MATEIDQPSNLDRQPRGYLLITGMLIESLRTLFAEADRLHSAPLEDFIYSPDISQTRVHIATADDWRPEYAGLHPALLVKRNPVAFVEQGIGGRAHGITRFPGQNEESAQLASVSDVKMVWAMQGSHTINCVGGTAAQVEELAHEVFTHFATFREHLRSHLGLSRFRPQGVTPVGVLKQHRDSYVARVGVEWSCSVTRVIRTLSPLLKAFSGENGESFISEG